MNNISFFTDAFDMTDAIDAYVRERIAAVDKLLSDNVDAQGYEVRMKMHSDNGAEMYHVDVTVRDGGETWRADAENADLYAAIDEIKDDLHRLISTDHDKQRTMERKGGAELKDMLHSSE